LYILARTVSGISLPPLDRKLSNQNKLMYRREMSGGRGTTIDTRNELNELVRRRAEIAVSIVLRLNIP